MEFHWNFAGMMERFFGGKSLCKLEKMLKNVIAILFDYLLPKSLSNKVIQIKSYLFYNVLLTQQSFPTNIGNYVSSQSNFSFIFHNIDCDKLLSYYIFLLLQYNTIYTTNVPSKNVDHSKQAYCLNLREEVVKF